MKKIFIAGLFISLATIVNADCNTGSCSGVTIDNLYAMSNGTIMVETTGNEKNLNCTSYGAGFTSIDPNAAGKNAIYSLLLTAQTTNKNVYIRIVENSVNCRIAYAFITK